MPGNGGDLLFQSFQHRLASRRVLANDRAVKFLRDEAGEPRAQALFVIIPSVVPWMLAPKFPLRVRLGLTLGR